MFRWRGIPGGLRRFIFVSMSRRPVTSRAASLNAVVTVSPLVVCGIYDRLADRNHPAKTAIGGDSDSSEGQKAYCNPLQLQDVETHKEKGKGNTETMPAEVLLINKKETSPCYYCYSDSDSKTGALLLDGEKKSIEVEDHQLKITSSNSKSKAPLCDHGPVSKDVVSSYRDPWFGIAKTKNTDDTAIVDGKTDLAAITAVSSLVNSLGPLNNGVGQLLPTKTLAREDNSNCKTIWDEPKQIFTTTKTKTPPAPFYPFVETNSSSYIYNNHNNRKSNTDNRSDEVQEAMIWPPPPSSSATEGNKRTSTSTSTPPPPSVTPSLMFASLIPSRETLKQADSPRLLPPRPWFMGNASTNRGTTNLNSKSFLSPSSSSPLIPPSSSTPPSSSSSSSTWTPETGTNSSSFRPLCLCERDTIPSLQRSHHQGAAQHTSGVETVTNPNTTILPNLQGTNTGISLNPPVTTTTISPNLPGTSGKPLQVMMPSQIQSLLILPELLSS